jgi:hypothetical protein
MNYFCKGAEEEKREASRRYTRDLPRRRDPACALKTLLGLCIMKLCFYRRILDPSIQLNELHWASMEDLLPVYHNIHVLITDALCESPCAHYLGDPSGAQMVAEE